MTNETRRIIRDGFGAIEDELRQRRATDAEILNRLDELIRVVGGDNAKIQALREDHEALTDRVQDIHERVRLVSVR